MNAARKALIKIQTAPPGVPVGRFQPQVAIIADFFDNLVNLKTENNALHRQLLEAHERFGKLLGDTMTPPASKPDQAQTASKLRGNSFECFIIDEYTEEDRAARRSPKVKVSPEIMGHIRNAGGLSRDDLFFNHKHICGKFGNTPAGPTLSGLSADAILSSVTEVKQKLTDEYTKLNEGAPEGYEIENRKYGPFGTGQKFSYKEFVAAGWNANQLIENGLLVKVQPNA